MVRVHVHLTTSSTAIHLTITLILLVYIFHYQISLIKETMNQLTHQKESLMSQRVFHLVPAHLPTILLILLHVSATKFI